MENTRSAFLPLSSRGSSSPWLAPPVRISVPMPAGSKSIVEVWRRAFRRDDRNIMKHHYLEIAIAIYLVLGILGYSNIGGAGAGLDPASKPSIFRRILVVLLWPLAMIGAIEG